MCMRVQILYERNCHPTSERRRRKAQGWGTAHDAQPRVAASVASMNIVLACTVREGGEQVMSEEESNKFNRK